MNWFWRSRNDEIKQTGLSGRDVELLSSYLDQQLNPPEQRRLEERLGRETPLVEALEGLRRTRAVLRSQPLLRAPRNFTLTPQMAGVSARTAPALAGAYPVLRLASVLATIFFIVVMAGDLFASQLQPAVVMQSDAPQPVMPFGLGGGGGGGGGAAEVGVPEPSLAQDARQALTATPEALEKSVDILQATPLAKEGAPAPQATGEAEQPILEAAPAALPAETGQAIAPAEQPAPEAPAMVEEPGVVENTSAAVQPGRSLLRLLQVALGLLAVISGLAALGLRRKGSL